MEAPSWKVKGRTLKQDKLWGAPTRIYSLWEVLVKRARTLSHHIFNDIYRTVLCHVMSYHSISSSYFPRITFVSSSYHHCITIVSSHCHHLIITMPSSYYCLRLTLLMIPHRSASITPTVSVTFQVKQEPIINKHPSSFPSQCRCSALARYFSTERDDPYNVQRLRHTMVWSEHPWPGFSEHDGLAKDQSLPKLYWVDKERSLMVAFCADGQELW